MLDIDIRGRNGAFELDARLRSDRGITVLFGRSGCGKSTLVDMLAGLRKPESGHIRFGETTVFDRAANIDLAPERRRVGCVFQDARLFAHYDVRGNLEYGLKRRRSAGGPFRFDDVVELLEIGGLLQRRPATLSGGERQRVSIGRALLSQPTVMLLDEPLTSLDVASREQLIPFIERLGTELRLPVIFVSHVLDEVVRLGESMAVMSAGRIVASGTVEDIMSRLDLRPLTGRHEAGAVFAARVEAHDDEYGLSTLRFGERQRLQVPRVELSVGDMARVRIRARDVSLALSEPTGTSVLNAFEGTVVDSAPAGNDAQVDVMVDVGAPLTARITRKSFEKLGLSPGRKVFAMIKGVAVDRRSIAQPAERARRETGD